VLKPYFETDLGKLYHGDCLKIMPELEPVDLVITSPPYDNLRDYKGYSFNFKEIAKTLYQKVKSGGVVVWVVGDATIDGSETGTSFKQALYFKDIGFNLHDTMIYSKDKPPENSKRYENAFEYMFVLSNGKPTTFNPIKVKAVSRYKYSKAITDRQKDGSLKKRKGHKTAQYKTKNNIWHYNVGFSATKNKIAFKHPATFPELLAIDHIVSWSNEKQIVMDPMSGSGTVAAMSERYNRRWIGIEISEEYCEIAKQRIINETRQRKIPGF